jgi:F-type H+-transporting ATPase subunit epsilon
MSLVTLDIITPERAIFHGQVTEVILPGELGQMGILVGHSNLMTLIRAGELIAKSADGERRFAVASGFAEVTASSVVVLVDSGEGASDIDVERARRALAAAESRSVDVAAASADELEAHQEELARARNRIAIFERSSRA